MNNKNTIRVDFQKIKAAAAASNKGNYKIAAEAGLTPAAIYYIFAGKTNPTAVNLAKICESVGLPIEDAFNRPLKKAA